MKSILQEDKTKCFLCERNPCGDHLDKHHVFGGPCRDLSEKYGLFIFIHHHRCHIFGDESVHRNAEVRKAVQRYAQEKAMQAYGWTESDFIKLFMRNFL